MISLEAREALYLPIVAKAFAGQGFDPAFGCAIAKQESGWLPETKVLTGGDLGRGGSYGLCCMSLETARSMHPDITVEQLLDPAINASLAAELCARNAKLLPPKLDKEHFYQELAARYNSGKPYAKAPYGTQNTYCTNVARYQRMYQNDARLSKI